MEAFMCCGGMDMYPDETGLLISELKPGDEILINYTDENLRERQKVAIIWQVDGFSAITTNGEPVSCGMGITIIPTNNHFKYYTVSRDAREALRKIQQRGKYQNFDSVVE